MLHLLFAPTVSRGGTVQMSGGNASGGRAVEVIEELPPVRDVKVGLSLPVAVSTVTLQPQGVELTFKTDSKTISFEVPEFSCHQMIELAHA